jgi:hypothetical protein
MAEGEPSLMLLDDKGTVRISAGIPEIGGIKRTHFSMFTEKGQEELMLEVDSSFSQLRLHNARGKSEVEICAAWDSAGMYMHSNDGAACVDVGKDGPAAELKDSQFNPFWHTPPPPPRKVAKKRGSRS